jgi:hypothetical protein
LKAVIVDDVILERPFPAISGCHRRG